MTDRYRFDLNIGILHDSTLVQYTQDQAPVSSVTITMADIQISPPTQGQDQEAHEAVFTDAAKTFVHKLVTTFVGDVDTILHDRKLRKGGRLLSLNRRQNALLVMNLDLDI